MISFAQAKLQLWLITQGWLEICSRNFIRETQGTFTDHLDSPITTTFNPDPIIPQAYFVFSDFNNIWAAFRHELAVVFKVSYFLDRSVLQFILSFLSFIGSWGRYLPWGGSHVFFENMWLALNLNKVADISIFIKKEGKYFSSQISLEFNFTL